MQTKFVYIFVYTNIQKYIKLPLVCKEDKFWKIFLLSDTSNAINIKIRVEEKNEILKKNTFRNVI